MLNWPKKPRPEPDNPPMPQPILPAPTAISPAP